MIDVFGHTVPLLEVQSRCRMDETQLDDSVAGRRIVGALGNIHLFSF